jgi:hypothetical protein
MLTPLPGEEAAMVLRRYVRNDLPHAAPFALSESLTI